MKNPTCPYCGAHDFIEVKHGGYTYVTKNMKNERLYSNICSNCGTILRTYIKNPQRLMTKAEKENQMT